MSFIVKDEEYLRVAKPKRLQLKKKERKVAWKIQTLKLSFDILIKKVVEDMCVTFTIKFFRIYQTKMFLKSQGFKNFVMDITKS